MDDFERLEEFIVNTDDVLNLVELYATRIKAYPGNRAYYQALSLQCGEYLLAAKKLNLPVVVESIQAIYQMAKVLHDRELESTNHQMEVFIEELQDLTAYFKGLFFYQDLTRQYISPNLPLLKNFIRQLSRQKPPQIEEESPSGSQEIVQDPFDEIDGLSDFVDSFADEIDSAFDFITDTPAATEEKEAAQGTLILSEREQEEVEGLFLSISGEYIEPVKDFISQLSEGTVNKKWVDICLSSLKIIEDAGTQMSYDKITRILERFKKLMLQAKSSDNVVISREIRLQLLKEYANLTSLMPEAFATADEFATRGKLKDGVIINVILRKTKGVGPISRTKLIAAGLNTLDKFYMANPTDLAAVSGIAISQAEAICQAFVQYRHHAETKDKRSTQIQSSLTRLFRNLRELRTVQKEYKTATRKSLYSPDHEIERDKLRERRQNVMWEINIILAELEQIQMVEDFRKMIYDRRIELLDQFLKDQASRHF